jgi:3-dehydroquinate dehydratase
MATLLCVPILGDDPQTALRDAVEARDAGADIIEFRIDPFFSGNEGPDSEDELLAILALVEKCPLDCIVTCRPVLEGGHYRGGDAARVALSRAEAGHARQLEIALGLIGAVAHRHLGVDQHAGVEVA